jgi:hypothetical protein
MSVPFLCSQAIFYSLGKGWRAPLILRPAIRDVKRKAGRDRRSLCMPYVVHTLRARFWRDRGVTVETFTDFQAAEEWLLGKPPWA